jgi:hypothetical protein
MLGNQIKDCLGFDKEPAVLPNSKKNIKMIRDAIRLKNSEIKIDTVNAKGWFYSPTHYNHYSYKLK